ncbi:hypothetical protein [Streptomyces sp. SAS_270]|uniref:hypothetical protein n=1 Tax=Streptomyces sp. SAS_270 TaxID=3412748 RepID=UPI00403CCABF
MADAYDFLLTIDLKDNLTQDEVTELRWHLGLGPQPQQLCILTEFPEVMLDDGEPILDDKGEIQAENAPYPVLAQRGPAWKIGGAALSELARREIPRPGWALTTRQALHPDETEHVDQLLDCLAARADYDYVDADGSPGSGGFGTYVGYGRFYEDDHVTRLLVIKNGEIVRKG